MRYLLSIVLGLCLWAGCAWAATPGFFVGAVTQGWANGVIVVGYSTIGATQTASTSANRMLAVGPFTSPAGTLTEIHAWLDNTASANAYDVILGVYDSGGTLVASGAASVAALTENSNVSVTGLNVTISAGSYKVAVFPQSTTFRYHSDTDAAVTWYYRDATTYGSLPTTFSSSGTVASRKMSAWFVVE